MKRFAKLACRKILFSYYFFIIFVIVIKKKIYCYCLSKMQIIKYIKKLFLYLLLLLVSCHKLNFKLFGETFPPPKYFRTEAMVQIFDIIWNLIFDTISTLSNCKMYCAKWILTILGMWRFGFGNVAKVLGRSLKQPTNSQNQIIFFSGAKACLEVWFLLCHQLCWKKF